MLRALIFAAAFWVVLTTTLLAQSMCAPRATVADRLKALYGEQHQITLVTATALVELWVNMATGTWTTVRTTTDGSSCILGSGTGIIMDRVPEPPGNDL